MVSVIAKVPITGGRFHSIGHKEVIQLFVECCGINPRLVSALQAVGDVMVSDYHGNGLYDVLKYKALYLKLAASRLDAIAVLMDEILMLQSSQGRDDISWGAEMSQSNRPPNKHQIAVHKKQQQQVCIQGPHGPIDLSKFERQSVGSVPAMATSNVSFEKVDQLAEVAGKGGEGIQLLVRGKSMQMTLPFDEFCASLSSTWFEEDWPPVMTSDFISGLGHHVFS